MKKVRYVLFSLSLLFVVAVLFASFHEHRGLGRFFEGTVDEPEITWSVEDMESGQAVIGEFVFSDTGREVDEIILLRSHWENYLIKADDSVVYNSTDGDGGAVRLIDIPECDKVRIEFTGASQKMLDSIKQSQIYTGDRLGMYMFLIRKNLYVGIFAIAALLLGVISIAVGLYMRSAWTRGLCGVLISLGVYILMAGLWVVTDSSLLLIFTQETGIVEIISFLSFYSLPIALLEFTKRMLPDKERIFGVLQIIFIGMLILYSANNIWKLFTITPIIVAEHTLMALTIVLVLKCCIQSLRTHADGKLVRVMLGYIAFSVCSILALVFFYMGNTRGYSIAYMLGIVGFVFFLAYAACIAAYEQIKENANLEAYAKMAYVDMMTELGNRAAFLEEKKLAAEHTGSFAYIMIDVNNLKTINDTLGHQKGDELIIEVARCIRAGLDGNGKCCRIGGDEFVVSLLDITESEVRSRVEAIQSEVAGADRRSDIPISAAMGYAWTDEPDKNIDELFKQADEAMYENKIKMKQQHSS